MLNPSRRNIKDIVNQVNEMNSNSLTYKNVDILSNFLNEQGKILPRRVTDLNSKQQKKITKLIKQARIATLIPFIVSKN
jgi:small subunit ribosomal protein S18|tara:strand:- start:5 stop:241 length:237 start_codon:yes stop_codon:yes gene_type:complete